jgi:hypothetical protein
MSCSGQSRGHVYMNIYFIDVVASIGQCTRRSQRNREVVIVKPGLFAPDLNLREGNYHRDTAIITCRPVLLSLHTRARCKITALLLLPARLTCCLPYLLLRGRVVCRRSTLALC